MSLANIRNGTINTIAAYGKWSASQISACDFGIMTLCASCVLLQPGAGTTIAPLSIGDATVARATEKTWSIAGRVMVKDMGDSKTMLQRLWTACDDIYESLRSDEDLGGTAKASMVTTISRPSMDSFITDGNGFWGYIDFTLVAIEYDE